MIEIEQEIKKLNTVKGNVRSIQKKMAHVHRARERQARFINGELMSYKSLLINSSELLTSRLSI